MSKEYFWGCELNKSNREYKWEPDIEQDDDQETFESHALILKQALIGASDSSDRGDVNIVELETEGYLCNGVKQPILRMTSGTVDYVQLDVYIPRFCILRLISGSGPVHITGQHIIEYATDDMSDVSDSHLTNIQDVENETVEVEEEQESINETGKRKMHNGKGKPKKVVKLDESDQENDEEMSDVEIPEKNGWKKSASKEKAKKEKAQKKKK